jgi:hypothetical protein
MFAAGSARNSRAGSAVNLEASATVRSEAGPLTSRAASSPLA